MNKKNERQSFLLAHTIIYAILIITELVLVNLQDLHYIDLPRWLLFSPTIIILLAMAFSIAIKRIKDVPEKGNTHE